MNGQLSIDEFLEKINICQEGIDAMNSVGTYGLTVDEAAKKLKDNGYRDFAAWILSQKKTEAYIKFNGSVLSMGVYQVFNPITGVHTRYETEAEAKAALVEIAKEVLKQHCPTVVQELSNENGDTTWLPTTMNETLVVS